MNNERIDYIDVVKGISIICIVLLHFEDGFIPTCINSYIGEFMITAFYLAVGWINAVKDRDISPRELISKRWIQLGKPYLYWSAIILIFDLILLAFGYFSTYDIARECYKTIVLRGIGTLWFLPALFGGELLWNWTKRKNSIPLNVIVFVAIVIYQLAYVSYFEGKTDSMSRIIDAPFKTLSSALDAWIGISFGYYMYKLCGDFIKRSSQLLVFAIGLVISLLAFMSANYFPLKYGDCAPLIGPLGLFFIFKAINIPVLSQYIIYWGKNSLGLMVTHFSLFMVICTIIQNKIDGTTNETLKGWPSVIYFVITMAVSYFVVELIKKTYPPLLGIKNKEN